jgi:hypothetical protein
VAPCTDAARQIFSRSNFEHRPGGVFRWAG